MPPPGARPSRPGAAVADLLRLDEAIASADLVVTDEGRFDATSLRGRPSARSSPGPPDGCPVNGGGRRVRRPVRADTLTALAGPAGTARAEATCWLRQGRLPTGRHSRVAQPPPLLREQLDSHSRSPPSHAAWTARRTPVLAGGLEAAGDRCFRTPIISRWIGSHGGKETGFRRW
ncbi:glycerate kinase [Streptomyces sp. NPDC057193]|uniref:glycerate kinase n=1 Tax=Streptomyces sp. NPDC057193 TaxID=3346043 RepID=UPI0036331BFA